MVRQLRIVQFAALQTCTVWSRTLHIFCMENVMTIIYCASCGKKFKPRPQILNQAYCSAPECQRERRRVWQKKKRQADPQYRQNDADYHKYWASGHPSYSRTYRTDHAEYTERNRKLQGKRNRKTKRSSIANENASTPDIALQSGRYWLVPISSDGIAKVDAWIVEITVISSGYKSITRPDK